MASRSGRLFQLNILEALFRSFAEHLLLTDSHEVRQQLALTPLLERRRNRERLLLSHEQASQALVEARRGLMWAVEHDRPADSAITAWQAAVLPRIETALLWTAHVLKQHRRERPEALRLRVLNAFPFGACDKIPFLRSEGSEGTEVLAGVVEWQEAERLAAGALRQFGFLDANITAAGADGGIDVSARRMVAQVKYTSKPVGRPVLQQLVGAADGRATACFARSGFTEQGREYAAQRGVALFTIELPTTVRAENEAARRLVALDVR